MNADISTPHLDLEDLVAEVTGRPTGDRVRSHLAGCEPCRLEASRWSLVADGVRGVMADAPEPALAAQPTRSAAPSRRTVRRLLATPRRRLVFAAAAAVLLGLAGYGLANFVSVSVHGPTGQTGTTTTLTAVVGCAKLEQATGTLDRVDGDGVVIRTPGGKLVTVATTPTTRLNASGPLLGDITDGAPVTAVGKLSGGTIAADFVVVGGRPSVNIPDFVVAQGTVSDASAAGFTVVTPAGARVPVTTSGRTVVTVANASLGQLRAGAPTTAVGYAGADGTLSAIAVFQPPNWLPGAHAEVTVKDCSPDSINHTIMALTYAG